MRRGPQCPECRNACMKLDVSIWCYFFVNSFNNWRIQVTSSQLHLQFSFYEFILDFNALEAEIAVKSSLKAVPEFASSVEFKCKFAYVINNLFIYLLFILIFRSWAETIETTCFTTSWCYQRTKIANGVQYRQIGLYIQEPIVHGIQTRSLKIWAKF